MNISHQFHTIKYFFRILINVIIIIRLNNNIYLLEYNIILMYIFLLTIVLISY